MRNCKGSKNPESFMVSAEVKQKERKKKLMQKHDATAGQLKEAGCHFFYVRFLSLALL